MCQVERHRYKHVTVKQDHTQFSGLCPAKITWVENDQKLKLEMDNIIAEIHIKLLGSIFLCFIFLVHMFLRYGFIM